MGVDLTPVHQFGEWWCKREDLAAYTGPDFPSGSKVRQYKAMAAAAPGVPMLVGCSADSAMQIYIAAAAHQTGCKGIIYTAQRALRSAATEYAIRMGAEVHEVRHGYLSVLRARARLRKEELGPIVQWSPTIALRDAFEQCANVPAGVRRIVVPTGSGLVAAGVLAGASLHPGKPQVVVWAVSNMADSATIIKNARKLLPEDTALAQFTLMRDKRPYKKWATERLPDGTPLDPFYAAKAINCIQEGDLFWPPGLRPVSAMPAQVRQHFAQGVHSA